MFPHNFNLLSKFYLWSIGAMFVIFGTVFSIYVHFEIETDIANDERIKSHELSDELAKSSDDLTLMVRSYVATRDLKYKYKFQEIIDIREGLAPRPLNNNIYVELSSLNSKMKVDYQKPEPFINIIQRSGFSKDEMAKLLKAKKNSDTLVLMEREAMAMVEHTGEQQQKAIALIFSHEYDEAKARVILPILQAHLLMEKRTENRVNESIVMADIMRLIFIMSGAILFFLLFRAYAQWTKLYRELDMAKRMAEAAEDAKGSFMANMSHEIRTPLNGIVGFVNLLSKSSLSSEQNRYIGII